MSEKKKKKKQLIKRLQNRFRLIVLNEDTFEERISLSLTPLKLFVSIGTAIILMILIVSSIIAFTPLREYIPGYADVSLTRKLLSVTQKSDSLEQQIIAGTIYLENVKRVLKGELVDEVTGDSIDLGKSYESLPMDATTNETALREHVEEAQEAFSVEEEVGTNNGSISKFFFFAPIKGVVSNSFNAKESHFGVDIVAAKNEPVKATMDGTVILATWSSETGHTIAIQHSNQIVSFYKHNSVLLKKIGDVIKAGEPIAIIGNSGELTSDPHLHFELWFNGTAIDPQEYVSL